MGLQKGAHRAVESKKKKDEEIIYSPPALFIKEKGREGEGEKEKDTTGNRGGEDFFLWVFSALMRQGSISPNKKKGRREENNKKTLRCALSC